jgi:hypothetical protein
MQESQAIKQLESLAELVNSMSEDHFSYFLVLINFQYAYLNRSKN